ncbi:hypothetical protein KAH94_02525 [bacterium]|nr:hypothetical protein [bacterium]
MNKLNDRMALRAQYNWGGAGLVTAANGQIVETTGADTASIAPPTGTGNRKGMLLKDVAIAAKKLDNDEMPRENRYLVIPPDMYWDFVTIEKASLLNLDYNKNLSNGDISNGVVAKVYGFNIVLRSHTLRYTNATTPVKVAVGGVGDATYNWGAVGFQGDEVSRALGSIEVLSQIDAPEYYGSIYSAIVRFNAEQLRSDGKGVVSIVQGQ